MLVWDHNKDGRITDITELMSEYDAKGNVAYANGYEKMKTFDKDNDGVLNQTELKPLNMWVDDGDALTEAGELKTLAEMGIVEVRIPKDGETMASSFVREEKERMRVGGGETLDDPGPFKIIERKSIHGT